MIVFLKRLVNYIDALNDWVGRTVSWLCTILVILICIDVTLRYFFNFSVAWVFEMEWYLFAIIFLLGAGYTLRHDKHVRVDVFYSQFSDQTKAWINLLGTIFFLMPLCVVVLITSIRFVESSFLINESSPDPGGLPYRFIIKAFISVGFVMLFLQSLSEAAKSIIILSRPKESINSES